MKIFSACLASLVVLALFPAAAPAQEDEDLGDEFELLEEDEEMLADEVKSASKRRQSIFDSPSAITVMTREDIQASGATSLVDLLRRVPGFDVYDMKPSFPLVGARALTESSNNLVLLLIDGREGNVELAGYPMWAALTIDIEEIERVEIIRGPGSTLYGANAFAAVISFQLLPLMMHLLGGGAVTAAETRRLLGPGELDMGGYLLCLLVVVVVAGLCMLTSRLGVLRVLKTYS